MAAAVAVTTVTIAERFEPSVPAPSEPATVAEEPTVAATADASITQRIDAPAAPAVRPDLPAVPRSAAEPLGPTTAALSVDGMELRLTAGTAAIAVGDSAPIELTTTRIGDLVVADVPSPAVEQSDGEARHVWPSVTEWYRALESGFEHGYTIDRPLHTGDTLTIDVAVAGAEPVDVDGDIVFVRDGEAPVWYRGLHVFDADGTTLPASMTASGSTITIEVDTTGATYPVTVDPIITEDQQIRTVSTAAGSPTSSVIGGFGVSGEVNTPRCGPGNALTGLTVWRTSESAGWLRALELECSPIVSSAGGVAVDNAATFTGPRFNDPNNVSPFPPLPPTTVRCADGSVVTGFQGFVGGLVDSIQLSCSPLLADGSFGTSVLLPSVGVEVNLPYGPFDCPSGFADGLDGTSGTDVNSLALTCSDIASGAAFGTAVAVDGNRMAVGAPGAFNEGEGPGGTDTVGAVYLYSRSGPGQPWTPDGVLRNPFPSYSEFGSSVSLAGTRLAIGSPNFVTGPFADQGAVRLYEFDGSTWNFDVEVNPGGAGSYGFGFSVDFATPDFLLIGAPGFVDAIELGPGQVFEYRSGALSLVPTGPVTGNAWMGYSVAADERPGGGLRIVVGAPNPGGGTGLYRVFDDVGSGFTQVDELNATLIGNAVDVSGDRIAYATTNNVVVRSTDDFGTSWAIELVTDVPRGTYPGTSFNRHFDLEGGTLAVGAPVSNLVQIFRYDGASWGGPVLSAGVDTLVPGGAGGGDRAGFAVALDGPSLVVGAPGDDGALDSLADAGAAYVLDVPVVATFRQTGGSFASWGAPPNWDVGVVPGPRDAAIIPNGASATAVFGNTIGRVFVAGSVEVGGLLVEGMDDRPSVIEPTGSVVVPPASGPGNATLVFRDDLQIRAGGALIVQGTGGSPTLTPGLLRIETGAGSVTVGGQGAVTNDGIVQKVGAGQATVQGALTWSSGADSLLRVEQGVMQFFGGYDFEGRTSIRAGAEVRFADGLGFVGTSTLEVEITGDSSTTGNYGRIVLAPGVAGTLDGTLRADFVDYDPTLADSYPIVSGCGLQCNDISGAFSAFETAFGSGVLDLVQVPGAGLELRVVENKLVSNVSGRTAFGQDVAVDGDVAVIGEPNPSGTPGTARVFERNVSTGEWALTFTQFDAGAARFGEVVAIGPSHYAVSSPTVGGGFVRVYRRSDNGLQGSAPGVAGDLAIDGELLAIGRPGDGVVDVYDISSGVVLDGSFTGFASADFGAAVDLVDLGGGDAVLVVGVPDASTGSGQVEAYKRSGGVWEASATDVVQSPQGPGGNAFGSAVAVDAGAIYVGEPLSDLGAGDAGTVHVFSGQPGDYVLAGTLQGRDGPTPVSSDTFGSSLDVDGDLLVVGAPTAQRFGIAKRDGAAYVFERTGGSWTEQAQLRAADGFNGEAFGTAVAISGQRVLVGAPADANDNGNSAGAVYTFDAPDPVVPPGLTFDFGVAAGSETVRLGTSVAVNELQPRTTTREATGSTLAAASVSSIRADDPQATALAQISVGATPLSSIVLESVPLSSIPLLLIDIDGGWARILAGSELENEPFASLTFGQVLAAGSSADSTTPAGRFAATPLSSIDVDGTPLSSIPLSSIVLADTPLSSIEVDFDWCEVVAELIPAGATCEDVLADLTLMEASLRGVPLSSIPLSSIPLSSIPLSSIPLSSIPLSSIQLERSPLSSIPLSSIDLAGTPLSSIPLSSIPLSSIPLSSIPLSSIPLSSIDLVGTPLSSIPTSIPLSSIDLRGVPLSSIPLSSIVLADTPLSSIPLSSIQVNTDGTVDSQAALAAWCAALAGSGYDCGSGVDAATTLRDLSVYGVPLSSIPLSSIPLSSIDLTNTPLSSIPLSSIPLSSIPLSSIPLSSIPLSSIDVAGTPLSSIPLSSIPLSSIDVAGTPLSSIPLSSIDLDATPLSSIPLSSIPLSSIPLSSIPLSSIEVSGTPLSSIPLSSIDIANTPLSSIPLSSIPLSSIDCSRVDCQRGTLADAAQAGAIGAGTTLGTIQEATSRIRFGTFVSALPANLGTQVIDAIQTSQLTLTDLLGLDGLTLGDLPPALFAQLTLGDLGEALTFVTFADLLDAPIIDPTTGQPFTDVTADLRAAIDGQSLTLGDLLFLGDLTLGDLLDGYTGQLTLLDIEPILGFISVADLEAALGIELDLGNATLGDLLPDDLGDLTISALLTLIGDLEFGELLAAIDDQLANFTLGDLLLALVDPGSLALGGIEFADVAGSELPPGTVPPTSLESSFTLTGSRSRPVLVEIDTPPGTSYVPGSGFVDGAQVDPVLSGSTIRWGFVAEPGIEYSITFDVVTLPRIGTTSFDATARVGGTDLVVPVSADVTIAEGAEPNDFPEVVDASEDFVYLTYISTPTDNDVYAIDLAENDQLVVQLSNLSADLDLVVWGRPADLTGTGPLSGTSDEAPIDPVTDPDADATATEPLDDFRRLDAIDPTLSLLGVANRSGTTTELFTSGRLPAGRYFVQVIGSNGATNTRPAALQLAVIEGDEAPPCSALGATDPGIARGIAPAIGSDVNTLILLNESRLERFYGAAGRQQVLDALAALTTHLEGDPTIVPAVVPVDGYASVEAAYDAWDTDGTCGPESANAVVAAINADVIDPVRDQLDHVVILGADEQIPMARLTDATKVANEYDYRYEFDGDLAGGVARNTFTSSFWSGTILSDEPYGDADARSLGDRFLYVSDLALGRVVESPSDIADALATFVEFDGRLAIDTAAVLGYDFLVDGSEEIAATLDAALPGDVDDELADGIVPATGRPWDRVDATSKLAEAAQNALISLNAHFDHYRALPAIGDKVPGFLDNLIAEDVAAELGADALQRSLVFSMGCHSGLSVSDITVASTNADWAQVLGQQGALYVGNTGFGYGDTETVAYTELLMALFAEQVTAPLDLSGAGDSSTVGQALAWAKNEFVAGLQAFSVYDEKAVMEATFYGLPFYRVGIPGDVLDPVPPPAPPAPAGGEALVTLAPTNTSNVTPSGTYFSNTGPDGEEFVIVAPGRPIQPLITSDVSASDAVARGALIESMSSTWLDLPDPVIAQPIFDEAAGQPEPHPGDAVFPARPLRISTSTGPSGRRQQLLVATGQYRSDPGVQRLDDAFDITVYYGEPGGDVTPPTFTSIRPVIDGDVLTVTADVTDENVVDRVVVLVAERTVSDTADWVALELDPSGGSSWSGSRTLAPTTIGVELLLQAKDQFGNVGVTTNKARNFADEVVFEEPEPAPGVVLDLTVDVTGDAGADGWFDGPVTVTPTGSNQISYSVDGGAVLPIVSGSSFTITGGGPHVWRVTTDVGEVRTGAVRIDDDGAPDVTILLPAADGDTFPSGTTDRFDVRCTDLSLATCAARLNGAPIAPGSPLPTEPGDYTLTVRSTDRVGNVATASRTFEVLPLAGPPAITQLDGPLAPVDQDATVTIEALFADISGTADSYTATFDWGDGTAPVTVTVTDEPTPAALGRAVGEHVYRTPGVYAVEVTIDDGAGGSDTATFSFVVIYDEDETGRVSGSGFFISGREAYPGTRRWGTPAFFGYHARYEAGASRPTGSTLMKLIGRFFFESTQYDYLTVNRSIAVAEGVGTMNGSAEYRFRVQGIDHGWLDFFQITIWDPATGDVVYDNGVLYDNGDLVLLGGIRIRQ